jgi:hypothetical protein
MSAEIVPINEDVRQKITREAWKRYWEGSWQARSRREDRVGALIDFYAAIVFAPALTAARLLLLGSPTVAADDDFRSAS